MKIRSKILLRVIIIFITLNLFVLISFTTVHYRKEVADLTRKIEGTTELFAKISAISLFEYDRDEINDNINSFLNDPDIEAIDVSDIHGLVNIYIGETEKNDKHIEAFSNIIYGKEVIGKVIITFTKSGIIEEASSFLFRYICIVLATSIILMFILILQVEKILKPISVLTKLTKNIISEEYTTNFKISTNDEIGVLYKNFMIMKKSINQKINELTNENKERMKAERELLNQKNNLELLINEKTENSFNFLSSYKYHPTPYEDD